MEYLLHFLNSNVVEYAYKTFYATMLGQDGIRWLSQHINNLPIPKRNVLNNMETLDVAEIYGLTNEDINFIENKKL